MRQTNHLRTSLSGFAVLMVLSLAAIPEVSAHCDTLDGPVILDARKAIEAKDITPVLKWIKPKDEKAVKAAFQKVISGKAGNSEDAQRKFFADLVRIHRAGEGAPFTGLKPAGAVEPSVAEADKALASGSADALVKLVTDDVAAGIRKRFEHAAATYRQKDESVAKGRDFVEAYVEFTHYVERLHQNATAKGAHGEHADHGNMEKQHKHDKKSRHSKH